MRWGLIGGLSLTGVAVGLLSVFGYTGAHEIMHWTIAYLACAATLGWALPSKHLQHGLAVGLLAGFAAPLVQVLLFGVYLAHNPGVASDLPPGANPEGLRWLTLALAPLSAIVSGIALGGLTWVAGRLLPHK